MNFKIKMDITMGWGNNWQNSLHSNWWFLSSVSWLFFLPLARNLFQSVNSIRPDYISWRKFLVVQHFFDCLKFFKSKENLFKGRIVLADMGASIKRFCKIFNMGRFVCHRHLIEKFWAKSPLGIMVTRLIKTKNETEYFQLCSEISVELKTYER